MTSLSSQLAGIKANNNATILDKSHRRKLHSVSLVYDPKEASAQDFETVYYESVEAFRELASIDSRFLHFEKSLFSETSIRFDRLVQSRDQDKMLNDAIEQFLMLLAQYLHLNIAFRALEWLVRRFQIQVHNVESLLLCTLPYHSTEQFVRILDIIYHQNFPAMFKFLIPCKQTNKGPSVSALVRVVFRDTQLFETLNLFELKVVKQGYAFERQLMFFAKLNCLVISVHKEQGTQTECADRVLPVISEFLALNEAQLASYIVFSVLVSQTNLNPAILNAAQTTIVAHWTKESQNQGLQLLCQMHAQADLDLDTTLLEQIINSFGIGKLVKTLVDQHNVCVKPFASKLVLAAFKLSMFTHLLPLFSLELTDEVVETLIAFILSNAPFTQPETDVLVKMVESVQPRISPARIDRIELSLQTHIDRNEVLNEQPDQVDQQEPEFETKIDANAVLEMSKKLPLAKHSFLEVLIPHDDPRALVWVNGSSLDFSLDEMRQISRVDPEHELSFALAMAIGPWPVVSRCTAIKFSKAIISFLIDTKKGGSPNSIDFQAVLGPLLFLLTDPQRRIRSAAVQLLDVLSLNSASSKSKFSKDMKLSWLGKNDFNAVVAKLRESSAEYILDNEYIVSAVRNAGKSALCDFLVSYCQTPLPPVLWVCLRCLASFKGVASKLVPLISSWNLDQTRNLWTERCQAAKFPTSALEKALVGAINSNDETGITFILEMLKTRTPPLTEFIAAHLIKIWNSVFHEETRIRVAKALVEMAIMEDVSFDSTEILNSLDPFETNIFQNLLGHPSSATPLFSEATKRRRRRSSSSVQLRNNSLAVGLMAEKHLRKTTVVLELLERRANSLTNPASLVFALFDTLEELMALGTDSHLPVLYTEELLANCLILLVEKLKTENTGAELGTLKVNVVVSCIRTSTSPQVQNRFLLLIAALAGLCPDAVLHGVMPIFTFMGAKTVRLDNDYSAHVIEHTIEQVVPALIAAGDKHEEIETALLSFVAAFPHIPRHRRTKLFGKLVDVLGPEQSLYKLLLLLGQRYADSVSSRRQSDAKSVVQFTIPFIRMFDAELQLHALIESGLFTANCMAADEDDEMVDDESKLRFGLLKVRSSLRKSKKACCLYFEFFAKTVADPHVVSGTQPLRVYLNSVNFDWTQLSELITALVAIKDEPSVQLLLERVLEALPIRIFVQSVKPMLETNAELESTLSLVARKFMFEKSDDVTAVQCATEITNLLCTQMANVPTSSAIDVCEQLIAHFGINLKSPALKLLDTLCGEAGLLNKDSDVVLTTILAINTVCQKLGAATFAYFSKIFPVLCEKVRNSQISARSVDSMDDDDGSLDLAAFALFAGLIKQMPKFVAPETPVILDLLFSSHISLNSRQQLLDVIEEKIVPETTLSAALASWPSVMRGGMQSVELFFPFLDRTVDNCSRESLNSESSHLTRLLISCLSTREQSTDLNYVNQIEAKSISSIINAVLKLNDQTFRPMFVRTVEWGFAEPVEARHISVLKFVVRVFSQLKSVITNYMGHILDQVCSVVGGESDPMARKLGFEALITSFVYDKSDFWQSPNRFEQVLQTLLYNFTTTPITHGVLVVKAITSLAKISSAQNRKLINEKLAAFLTTASSQQKVWGIRVFSSLYKHLGEDWVSNLPQLVPIIAELLDDDDESVELETRKSLVPVIENVLGESLDRYLA